MVIKNVKTQGLKRRVWTSKLFKKKGGKRRKWYVPNPYCSRGKILQIGRDIFKPNFQWRKPLNCRFSIFDFLMASGVITTSFFCFRFLMVKATILKSLMRSCVIAHPGRPEQLKPVSSAVMLQIQPPSKSFIKEKNLKFQNPQVPTGITWWFIIS